MTLERALRYVVLACVFVLPFLALYVARSMFFPFITGKNFGFRILTDQTVDKCAHGAFGLRAHETVEGTAVAEGIDGRQRLDAQLPGNTRMLIDVDFDEANLAPVAPDDLLQHGSELFARPAPAGPEIDDHRDRT